MKIKLKIPILLIILILLCPTNMVSADGYITDILKGLEDSNIYVDPIIDGPGKTVTVRLQKMIRDDDNIILVVLPAVAEEGTDIYAVASELSTSLGNSYIIGLSIGNKVVGYAPSLPIGVATDLMKRADSVSNDPVTALSTFTQNVHSWLTKNPQPTATPILQPENKDGKSRSWAFWVILLTLAAAVSIVFLVLPKRKVPENEKTTFKAPSQIKSILSEISKKRQYVDDLEFKNILQTMCLDIEKYFLDESTDKEKTAVSFKERLNDVLEVVDKYIEIQDNERYFYEPKVQMKNGKESVSDFSIHVLESIREGNAADLIDYKVNSNILQAQRYK